MKYKILNFIKKNNLFLLSNKNNAFKIINNNNYRKLKNKMYILF